VSDYEVVSSRTVHRGRVITLRTDQVRTPGGAIAERDVVEHPGAVVVVALEGDQVMLVSQYRHPVRGDLTELPAGLLDTPGEDPFAAARRELYEEADLWARTWNTLLDLRVSPGGMNEVVRVYLARDVTRVPDGERFRRGSGEEYEEATMRAEWVPLDRAVADVCGGVIQSVAAVAGLLAVDKARAQRWQTLRPADVPWPPHILT